MLLEQFQRLEYSLDYLFEQRIKQKRFDHKILFYQKKPLLYVLLQSRPKRFIIKLGKHTVYDC